MRPGKPANYAVQRGERGSPAPAAVRRATARAAIAGFLAAWCVASPASAAEGSVARRNLFLAVAGALALVTGAAGLHLALGSRRKRGAERVPAPPKLADRAPEVRWCPTCKRAGDPGARHCAGDGNRLVDAESFDPDGPPGALCPVCARGFDPGVAVCDDHDEELVPLVGALEAEGPGPGICPRCGQRGDEARFCPLDGARLEPIN